MSMAIMGENTTVSLIFLRQFIGCKTVLLCHAAIALQGYHGQFTPCIVATKAACACCGRSQTSLSSFRLQQSC